jgi:hypothetical protein
LFSAGFDNCEHCHYPVVAPALTTLRRPDFLEVHRFVRTVWLRLSPPPEERAKTKTRRNRRAEAVMQ